MYLLKKYANRRIYDTNKSCYITLEDVKHMVEEFQVFQVVDAKTNEDITAQILLQIIIDQESKFTEDKKIFTQKLLEQLIRTYSNPLQLATSNYMEKTMDFVNSISKTNVTNPVETWSSMLNQNMNMWQSMMNPFGQEHKTNNTDENDDTNKDINKDDEK